jgi:hypothetical protein
MTSPGPNPVLLGTAFSKFCEAEVAATGRGQWVAPQAAERLLRRLIAGQLHAWGPGQSGGNEEIPTGYWEGQAESFWPDISLPNAFHRVVVDGDELCLALARSGGAAAHQAPKCDPLKAKSGRPPAADPYAVAWVVGSLVYADVLKRSQDDAISKIIEKFEAVFGEGKAPGRTTLQPMVRRLFSEMRKQDNEVEQRSSKAGK